MAQPVMTQETLVIENPNEIFPHIEPQTGSKPTHFKFISSSDNNAFKDALMNVVDGATVTYNFQHKGKPDVLIEHNHQKVCKIHFLHMDHRDKNDPSKRYVKIFLYEFEENQLEPFKTTILSFFDGLRLVKSAIELEEEIKPVDKPVVKPIVKTIVKTVVKPVIPKTIYQKITTPHSPVNAVPRILPKKEILIPVRKRSIQSDRVILPEYMPENNIKELTILPIKKISAKKLSVKHRSAKKRNSHSRRVKRISPYEI